MKTTKIEDTSTDVYAMICVMAMVAVSVIVMLYGAIELQKASQVSLAMREVQQQFGWMMISVGAGILLVTVPVLLLLNGIYREARLTRMILQHCHGMELYGIEGLKEAEAKPHTTSGARTE